MKEFFKKIFSIPTVIILGTIVAIIATCVSYHNGSIIAYGDAESHLNIAKRVVDSPTPGFSQLGGIWLPLPHLLMIPFVAFDFLWRSGLAGSIVSGIAFIISSLYIYKIVFVLSENRFASFIGSLVILLNPNMIYMQTTPMTENLLVMFFILSTYFFIQFIRDDENFIPLVLSGFFGFCATLSRYDGWFLVAAEAGILFLYVLLKKHMRQKWMGKLILFATPAFFGIFLWFMWDFLILGDPMYFSDSPFSAKSQQQGWLGRGELLTYHNLSLSTLYYAVTSLRDIGILLTGVAILGFLVYLFFQKGRLKFIVPLLFLVPFLFYVVTLFTGQSVIFIPDLTPKNFQWNLFNVRYGIMMIPFAAFFIGILAAKLPKLVKPLIIIALIVQTASFATGNEKVLTYEDGVHGLSAEKGNNAQLWLAKNYTGGYVLLDDYARTVSIIKSNIPMQDVIYIGNKPYWEESLKTPEKYADWIVMQKDDAVWKNLYENPKELARVYKYYKKAYTSPQILIFEKNGTQITRLPSKDELVNNNL